MDINTQIKVREIVKNNVKEIIGNYLTEDFARRIINEILSGVEWDLGNMEEEKA